MTATVPAPAPFVPLAHLPAIVVGALASGEGISVDLAPSDLGRLRIEMSGTSGAVDVRLVVERAETLPLVRAAIEALAQDLRQAGIQAQSVTVELLAIDRADPLRGDAVRTDGVQTPSQAADTSTQADPWTQARDMAGHAANGRGSQGQDGPGREAVGSVTDEGRGDAPGIGATRTAMTDRVDLRM